MILVLEYPIDIDNIVLIFIDLDDTDIPFTVLLLCVIIVVPLLTFVIVIIQYYCYYSIVHCIILHWPFYLGLILLLLLLWYSDIVLFPVLLLLLILLITVLLFHYYHCDKFIDDIIDLFFYPHLLLYCVIRLVFCCCYCIYLLMIVIIDDDWYYLFWWPILWLLMTINDWWPIIDMLILYYWPILYDDDYYYYWLLTDDIVNYCVFRPTDYSIDCYCRLMDVTIISPLWQYDRDYLPRPLCYYCTWPNDNWPIDDWHSWHYSVTIDYWAYLILTTGVLFQPVGSYISSHIPASVIDGSQALFGILILWYYDPYLFIVPNYICHHSSVLWLEWLIRALLTMSDLLLFYYTAGIILFNVW